MKAEFWHQRWQDNLIGFHLDEVNPYLKRFYPELGLKEGQRIFVPLCGKSLDLMWLAEQGLTVVGVELSHLAVSQFFNEQGLKAEVREQGPFEIWQAQNITLFCGDFFDLTPDWLGAVDGVYDRASMVALPLEMRERYIHHLLDLCPVPMPRLLVSLDYDQDKMDGPPFAVSAEEIEGFYSKSFKIKPLLAEDVLGENDRFREKGLDRLVEAVYLLN